MTKSLDLSGKIDPLLIALFETLHGITTTAGSPYFVVGATARDLILEQGLGLPSTRATDDADVGLCVSDWSKYQGVVKELITTGDFTKEKEAQRFLFRGQLLVDFLPFGEIGGPDKKIHWPPDQSVVMSVAGFEDAYKAALNVKVRANPPLDILVASLPGLVILKIVAWSDRPLERGRDAIDLGHIMKSYSDAGNYMRLLDEHTDLVEVENFDYVRAGARLLGRDISRIASTTTKERVLSVLEEETVEGGHYRMLQQMKSTTPLSQDEEERLFAENLSLLQELKRGIQET